MILKRRKRERMNVRPPERVDCKPHLQWVRGHDCVVANSTFPLGRGVTCDGRIEAHHVRVSGEGTTGKKPGDDKVVSLCVAHHIAGHRSGWRSFEERYRVDLTAIAAALWKQSPHRIKWEQKNEQ